METSGTDSNPDRFTDIAAVLLAGGQSRRMGRDKALLSVNGIQLVQRISDRLHELTQEVILSASDPSAYSFLRLPSVPDRFRDQGPMAGLHAGMLHTTRPCVLLVACDLPRVTPALLRCLIRQRHGYDIVIPVTAGDRPHPVCALYRLTCISAIDRNLRAGENRLISLLDEPCLQVRRWHIREDGFAEDELSDLDRPEDLEALLRMRDS